MTHTRHNLVYLGQMQGEFGGSYPAHWCRTCGAFIAGIGSHGYEMLPERAGRARNLPVTYVADKPRRSKKALGRGLASLMGASGPKALPGSDR